jgi:hypothetical protein
MDNAFGIVSSGLVIMSTGVAGFILPFLEHADPLV